MKMYMYSKPLRVVGCLLVLLFVFSAVNAYDNDPCAATVDSKPTAGRSIVGLEQIQSLEHVQDDSSLGLDPVRIYGNSNRSVVTVQGARLVKGLSLFGIQNSVEGVIGSGFVIKYLNSHYVVTNFHVIDSLVNVTVTFWNGDAYAATVIGSDPYSDIGVLSTKGGEVDPIPLAFDSSSLVRVGQPVMAIGNPYGLSGSVTFGIVSQVGRTIQYQSTTGSFLVADAIQFSAPINPGNSGGPLLDANGMVVGITSAAVSGSQGVGFAIPSDTITRELPFLITVGKYDRHPYLGVRGADMNYLLAQAMGINITYGLLVVGVTPGGPADKAGLKVGQRLVTIGGDQYPVDGDIIISMNGVRIVNSDAFAAYIEEHLTPGDTVQVGIIRSGALTVVQVTVAARPSQ
jgi:S1-C subfamily serine protease